MTIPNFITIARLIGVPLIVWLMIADRFVEATVLFILAGLSDAADGFIAKRFNAASELGAYLDPVADKALLVSVFCTLGFKGALPAWLIVLAVSRDLFIIGGMLLAYVLTQPDGGEAAMGVEDKHHRADRSHCFRPRRANRRDDVSAAHRSDRTRCRGVDRRIRRCLSRRMGPAYGRRPGRGERGQAMNLRTQAVFWIGALFALLLFLWVFSDILLPFIMGMALAYLLDPLADRLERSGMSRFWATITIVFLTVLILALVAIVAIPLLAAQLSGFLERLPSYATELQALGNRFFQTRIGQFFRTQGGGPNVDQMVSQGASWIATLIASVWAGGQALISVISLIVVTPVVAFYLLYDWDHMLDRVDALLPREHAETIRAIGRDINVAIAGFIRGQGAVCLFLGLFYAISLSVIGLNFGFLIGSTAGLISFIPFVGTIVGFLLSVGVALVQFWPDWPWIVGSRGDLRGRAVHRREHPAATARRFEHRRAPGLADVRAFCLRLAVRLRRRAARRPRDGGDRRARPLRGRPLPAERSLSRSGWRAAGVGSLKVPGAPQLPLALPHAPSYGRDDFMPGPSNEVALRLIESWPAWPSPVRASRRSVRLGKNAPGAYLGVDGRCEDHGAGYARRAGPSDSRRGWCDRD